MIRLAVAFLTALSLAVLLWPRLARAARNRIHPDSEIHKFFR